MHLAQIGAENFRLFEQLSLQPHHRLNLIFGPNAAGKTSLLETIYTLGRGKSFRGTSPAELAGSGGRSWRVAGALERGEGPASRLGVGWSTEQGTQIRLNQAELATAELVRQLPVQILEPGMHRLLQEGPGYRRAFLDWGVFHVEHRFLPAWRRFQRALRQRNQSLRQGASDAQVRAWEPELVAAGETLHDLRCAHLERIHARVMALIAELLGPGAWAFDLCAGWPAAMPYGEALRSHLERDRRMGMTLDGPHRAELRIRSDRHAVKNRISRGQQKLLIAAMLLGQAEEIAAASGQAPILLVDDFAAELADGFQQALLGALRRYPGQVFITSFERNGALAEIADSAMFHVEQGRLRALSAA